MSSEAVEPPAVGADPPAESLPGAEGISVRELIALLGAIEDELRSRPFLVERDGMMVVNPEVAPLLSRQRRVVRQLRARRVSWGSSGSAGGGTDGAVRRHPRPRPPWS